MSNVATLDDVLTPYQQWRFDVGQALDRAQLYREKNNFEDCGKYWGNFEVLVCESDLAHAPKAIPFTCHLRFCPDCEHREQARKLARYIPGFKNLTDGDGRADFTMKKIELTTPYSLEEMDSPALLRLSWGWVEKTLKKLMYKLREHELTPAEKRRQEINFTQHGLALLVACEFGERGKKLHFHILAYAPYIPKQLLTETWQDVTGGECEITWIKRVEHHDVEDAVTEVAKYITKFTALEPRLIPNLVRALAGTRRVRTYGVIRNCDVPERQCNCSHCSAKLTLIRVSEYFERCLAQNITPDEEIARKGASFLLDLKHGNNSWEPETAQKAGLLGIPPPDRPTQTVLDGFQGLTKPKNIYF